MNAPYDKNGKTISKGSYVKFKNNLWEVFDWKHSDSGTWTLVWLEPRAGNEFLAQWAYDNEIEITDLQQLHLDLSGTDARYFAARNEAV
jgi:hypothetical protein